MTSDELLDLVSEDDEIIGDVWRNQANLDPTLFHREVSIIIHDEDDRVLLQQRKWNKTVAPGFWSVAAEGHVPKGNTALVAAHMEITEELGFDTELTFWDKELIYFEREAHFTYWFVGKYHGETITLQQSEVEDMCWLKEDEFDEFTRNNNMAEYTQKRLQAFWEKYAI